MQLTEIHHDEIIVFIANNNKNDNCPILSLHTHEFTCTLTARRDAITGLSCVVCCWWKTCCVILVGGLCDLLTHAASLSDKASVFIHLISLSVSLHVILLAMCAFVLIFKMFYQYISGGNFIICLILHSCLFFSYLHSSAFAVCSLLLPYLHPSCF